MQSSVLIEQWGKNLHYIFLYFALISILACVITLYDKLASKAHCRRVKEGALLLISILGGSVSMLLTMLAIRHKTRHAKFMAGIPLVILLQAAITALIIWLGANM